MQAPKLIIPMSGLGSRFVNVGYNQPKPLIMTHGRSFVEWVLKAFDSPTDPIFICRQEHLDNTNMRQLLLQLAPDCQIIGIEGQKLGPVWATLQALPMMDIKGDCFVSYCDYYMTWNYKAVVERIRQEQLDGFIPCYTGFHPHLLIEKNLYASCKTESEGYLVEIKEKFTHYTDKTQSLFSPGAYYFKSFEVMKRYHEWAFETQQVTGTEYFTSLVYNGMVNDQLKVKAEAVVQYFCQWGTPEDFHEYQFWVDTVIQAKQKKEWL